MDYASSGLDIQAAMVDLARKYPDKKTRPSFLLWDGLRIQTSDWIDVPAKGRLAATFKSCSESVQQGFDLKFSDGFLLLEDGARISHLRTWFDTRFEPCVEYEFQANDRKMVFWNVYKRVWPDGEMIEEYMTGNSGFWVEKVSDSHRIYHCSSYEADPPDFESMVVELKWWAEEVRP